MKRLITLFLALALSLSALPVSADDFVESQADLSVVEENDLPEFEAEKEIISVSSEQEDKTIDDESEIKTDEDIDAQAEEIQISDAKEDLPVTDYAADEEKIEIFSDEFNSLGIWGAYVSGWTVDGSGENLFSCESGGGGKNDTSLKVVFDKNRKYKNSTGMEVASLTNTMYMIDSSSMNNVSQAETGKTLVIEMSIKPNDYNSVRSICFNGTNSQGLNYIVFDKDGSIGASQYIWGANNSYTKVGTYEAGKWYNIAVEITFGSKWYNMYINGERVVKAEEEKLAFLQHPQYNKTEIEGIKDLRILNYPAKAWNKSSSGAITTTAVSPSDFDYSETYYDDVKLYLGKYDVDSVTSKLEVPEKYTFEDQILALNGLETTVEQLLSEVYSSNKLELFDKNWNPMEADELIEDTCYIMETTVGGNVYAYTVEPFTSKINVFSDDFSEKGAWGTYVNGWTAGAYEKLYSYETSGGEREDKSLKLEYDSQREYGVQAITNSMCILQNSAISNVDRLTEGETIVVEMSMKAEDYNAVRELKYIGTSGQSSYIIFDDEGNILVSYQEYGTHCAYTKIGTYETGKWHNIALELTLGSQWANLYIDGVKIVDAKEELIPFVMHASYEKTPITGFGSYRIQTYPAKAWVKDSSGKITKAAVSISNLDPSVTYYDDLSIYVGMYNYKTAASTVSSDYYTVENGNLYYENDTILAKEFKEKIKCKTDIVIYKDDTFTEIIADDEVVGEDAVLLEKTRNSNIFIYRFVPNLYFNNVWFDTSGEENTVTVKGILDNKTLQTRTVIVVAAAYAGDVMQKITAKTYTFSEATVPIELKPITTDSDTTSVEAWVIDSWTNRKSYSKTHKF